MGAQKKYEDFAKRLYEQFPDIEESSIDEIADYGLKRIYYLIKTDGDVHLTDQKFSLFMGESQKEGPEQWKRSQKREHSKIRKLFKEKKIPWDKWHYIGLTDEENQEFIENKFLPSVTLYKLIKECAIRKNISHIYRTNLKYDKPDKEVFWAEKRENYPISQCEYSEEGAKWLSTRIAYRESKLKKEQNA